MYAWAPLGCGNYAPNFFGTSVPEVVEVRENPDGTVTLTVNAVCDMVICDDALITHDLRVKSSNCKLTTLAYHSRILFTDFFSQSRIS